MERKRRKKFREDNFGGMPGIAKLGIFVAIVCVVAMIAVPKFKKSREDKDIANIQKLTEVLQNVFSDAPAMEEIPHGRGGVETEYSLKDICYYGGGGSSNGFYDYVKAGIGDDFPDALLTTAEDVKIKIIGNKNYLEIYLYAGDSSVEDNMLAHFYSPTTRGDVDPEGLKYKFYDAKK